MIGGALTLVTANGVTRPLNHMIAMLRDIAEGEGTPTKHHGSVRDRNPGPAEWFNQFVERVHSIIKDVARNSSQVSTASENLVGLAGN